MDIGIFQAVWTAIALVAFIGIVVWTYSRKRKDDFDRAARMPLDDDD